ncbi:hypothetical protein GCM10027456_20350 [Kineosporia babensis]
MASFQRITEQLDAKVSTLLTVHLSVIALLAGGYSAVLRPRPVGLVPVRVWIASAVVLLGVSMTSYALLSAFRPIVAAYAEFNHWGCGAGGRVRPLGRPTAQTLTDEAWLAAEAVGRIAAVKNRRVQRAVSWLLVTVLAGLVWWLLLPV